MLITNLITNNSSVAALNYNQLITVQEQALILTGTKQIVAKARKLAKRSKKLIKSDNYLFEKTEFGSDVVRSKTVKDSQDYFSETLKRRGFLYVPGSRKQNCIFAQKKTMEIVRYNQGEITHFYCTLSSYLEELLAQKSSLEMYYEI